VVVMPVAVTVVVVLIGGVFDDRRLGGADCSFDIG
jgi:hypothetical protein